MRGGKASKRDLHFLSLALIYGNKRQERSGAPEHTGGLFPREASTRRGASNSVLPAATASLPPAVGTRQPCCASHTWAWTGKHNSHLTPNKPPPKQCPVLCMPGSHLTPCLTFPLGTGLAANLECTRLFWSTRGLQCWCTTGLRAGCSQNTTVCYCC